MQPGGELLMASDGLFDQLACQAREAGGFVELLGRSPDGSALFDAVERTLQEALQHHSQTDDISLVAVRRPGEAAPERPVANDLGGP
jgi:serine phosphatase RsbU (regulator of sigma subunit)